MKRPSRCMSFAIVGLITFVLCSWSNDSANADTLYDDLDRATLGQGFVVNALLESGFLFTFSDSLPVGSLYQVDSYGVQLSKVVQGNPTTAVFQLYDNDSGVPGAVLDTFMVSDLTDSIYGEKHFPESTLHPIVTAGEEYWMTVRLLDQYEYGLNWHGAVPLTGDFVATVANRNGDAPWYVQEWRHSVAALRIVGTSVPESSALLLMSQFGLTVLFSMRGRWIPWTDTPQGRFSCAGREDARRDGVSGASGRWETATIANQGSFWRCG